MASAFKSTVREADTVVLCEFKTSPIQQVPGQPGWHSETLPQGATIKREMNTYARQVKGFFVLFLRASDLLPKYMMTRFAFLGNEGFIIDLVLIGKRIPTKRSNSALLGSRQGRPSCRQSCPCTGNELPWEGAHPQEATQSNRHQHNFIDEFGLYPDFPKFKSGTPGETGLWMKIQENYRACRIWGMGAALTKYGILFSLSRADLWAQQLCGYFWCL